MSGILRIALFFTLAALTAAQSQYCDICSSHTLCIYPGKSPTCSFTDGNAALTAEDKANIVHLHNVKRNTVAAGEETRGSPGGQPKAANMNALVWDDELATIAQRWADQCNYGHDSCRNIKGGWVGQNVAATWSSGNGATNWNSMVNLWYDEVANFPNTGVKSYGGQSGTGHYTAIVWAKTTKVGCGYSKYKSDLQGYAYQTFYVCNYYPGGNVISQPIYEEGAPRSACPNSPLNNAYPALCN